MKQQSFAVGQKCQYSETKFSLFGEVECIDLWANVSMQVSAVSPSWAYLFQLSSKLEEEDGSMCLEAFVSLTISIPRCTVAHAQTGITWKIRTIW